MGAKKRNRMKEYRSRGIRFGTCEVCGTELGKRGGYGGTGMCGPCCTGESETLDERGETW
jgi:hypothetical protein